MKIWLPRNTETLHLAYVEWFTPFATSQQDRNHGMYRISRLRVNGEQQASVIPVKLIRQSVHLFPKFGPVAPDEWRSSKILDQAQAFHANPFSDRFTYSTLY